MYLRTNRNSQGKEYLQIVRSYRDNGKVRQEVLFTLGRLDILKETGQIDALVAALSRFATKQNFIDLAKDISIDDVYYLGSAHVVSGILRRSRLFDVFHDIASRHPRLGLPWTPLIFGMVLSRFVSPCSKRRFHGHWWERIYPELLGIQAPSLHWLYRAMDVLYKHREQLELALFDRGGQRDLFNQELDVVFYDTTTLRFESAVLEEGTLRQFGYSKERRSDCTQVVLGLLIDRDGIPVGYELFPGNTYDGKCVPAILAKLKEKFRIGNVVLVADRGMLSDDNLASLRQAKMEFIIGMRLWSEAQEDQRDFYNLGRYRSLTDGLKIREIPWGDERLVLTWSEDRAQRDAKAREDILDKIRAKLQNASNPKRFVTHSAYRKFLKGLDKGKPSLDHRAIVHAQKRDGFFGILTNVAGDKLSAGEVVSRYKELWKVEDAFGEIKGPLETRPMFHWTDRRIEAHVLLCLLAYYVEAIITKTLRDKKADFTAGAFFRALNEIYAVPVKAHSSVAWIRNEIKGTALKGYQFLNLKPPDRVLKIESTGSVVARNFSKCA